MISKCNFFSPILVATERSRGIIGGGGAELAADGGEVIARDRANRATDVDDFCGREVG